jgi:hypothetical protein
MLAIIQVLFAICVVIILFLIGFSVYNYEYVKSLKVSNSSMQKEAVPIFAGIKDPKLVENEIYTTNDKSLATYRDINNSAHQKGGVEFSYTFWLYLKESSTESTNNFSQNLSVPDEGFTSGNINNQTILFVKGSNKLQTYKNVCNKDKIDVMVKCPLVKLERNRTQLTVEFNTVPMNADGKDYVEGIKQGAKNACDEYTSDWKKANAHKLTLGNIDRAEFSNKWILVSIVLHDTLPTDPLPYRNKSHCTIYINNMKELETYVDGNLIPDKDNFSTIKMNKGALYLFPKLSLDNNTTYIPQHTNEIMMSNLTYYNYAIDTLTVDTLFTRGPSKYTAPAIGADVDYSPYSTVAAGHNKKLTTSP